MGPCALVGKSSTSTTLRLSCPIFSDDCVQVALSVQVALKAQAFCGKLGNLRSRQWPDTGLSSLLPKRLGEWLCLFVRFLVVFSASVS